MFQFPLHRDPRCNQSWDMTFKDTKSFSSLYIGILAATKRTPVGQYEPSRFQFPLHRDPRCNVLQYFENIDDKVKFQFPLHRDPRCNLFRGQFNIYGPLVSVPFTSGSSLQRNFSLEDIEERFVSVPFTSGSSLQPI